MIRRRLFAILAAFTLAGCAVGNEYDYSGVSANVPKPGVETLALAVADFRPYVLSGEKTPDFVGLQRGGFGNPFDVTTASGLPLAQDMTELLVKSFAAESTATETITLAPGDGANEALARFGETAAEKLLLIEMAEWKSDVYAQVTVHWDLTAKVFDRSGQLLGEDSMAGSRGTGSSGLFEAEKSRIAGAEAARVLGELLAAPAISSALR